MDKKAKLGIAGAVCVVLLAIVVYLNLPAAPPEVDPALMQAIEEERKKAEATPEPTPPPPTAPNEPPPLTGKGKV